MIAKWHAKSHHESSRREFLAGTGSFALAAAIGGPARAAMGPNDKFDLLIKGADALDPSQSLRGKRDIGIRYGVIEAVEGDIPAARALRVLDNAAHIDAIITVSSGLMPIGLQTSSEAQIANDALRPLASVVRSARMAALSAILYSAWRR